MDLVQSSLLVGKCTDHYTVTVDYCRHLSLTAPGIVDPAVLVAQPAVSSGLQFMSQGFDPVPQGTLQQPAQQPSQSVSVGGVTDLTQQTQSSVAQQSHPPQITSEYASPTYSQPVLQQVCISILKAVHIPVKSGVCL